MIRETGNEAHIGAYCTDESKLSYKTESVLMLVKIILNPGTIYKMLAEITF